MYTVFYFEQLASTAIFKHYLFCKIVTRCLGISKIVPAMLLHPFVAPEVYCALKFNNQNFMNVLCQFCFFKFIFF